MAIFRSPDLGEFPFDRSKLLNTEAIVLERVTGAKLKDIIADFNDNFGPLGVSAFLWLAMRRAGHHVRFEDLEFDMATLGYDRSDESPDRRERDETADPTAAAEPKAASRTARRTAAGSKTRSTASA